jgi:S1-C subfamily serine protease
MLAAAALATPLDQVKTVVVRVVVVPTDGVGPVMTGTGFKVATGAYLTNHHVVDQASSGDYQIWLIPSAPDTHPIEAHVRAQIADDLALLGSDDIAGPPLAFASTPPEAGSTVMALGYPAQMDDVLGHHQVGQPSQPDVTVGAEINSADRQEDDGASVAMIVHSASLWPGNSGGPLIDKCGRVVGVNTWLHSSDGLAQQNIAIAAGDVVKFLSDNQVTPAIDTRVCNDGVLAAVAATAPPPPAKPTAPPRRRDDDGGLGLMALVGLAVLAAAGGLLVIVGHRERQARSAIHSASRDPW